MSNSGDQANPVPYRCPRLKETRPACRCMRYPHVCHPPPTLCPDEFDTSPSSTQPTAVAPKRLSIPTNKLRYSADWFNSCFHGGAPICCLTVRQSSGTASSPYSSLCKCRPAFSTRYGLHIASCQAGLLDQAWTEGLLQVLPCRLFFSTSLLPTHYTDQFIFPWHALFLGIDSTTSASL